MLKKLLRSYLILLVFNSITLPLYAASNTSSSLNGWEIVRHSSVLGIEEFYVTKNHIRFDNKYVHAIFSNNSNMVDVFNNSTQKYTTNLKSNILYSLKLEAKQKQDKS